MRIAISGSHGVGKSTLIAAFLDRHPDYAHEPEAFEVLADDVDLADTDVPSADGLRALLEYTVDALESAPARVVIERSPADYLAYAAASGRAWPPGERQEFLGAHTPAVRACLRQLDVIAYVPLSGGRSGEDERFRRRVDLWLRRILLDDAYDLVADGPRVVVLPPEPDRQLAELSRLARSAER